MRCQTAEKNVKEENEYLYGPCYRQWIEDLIRWACGSIPLKGHALAGRLPAHFAHGYSKTRGHRLMDEYVTLLLALLIDCLDQALHVLELRLQG